MFCQGCGNEMADDAVFCPKCGRPVAGGVSPYTVAAAPPKDPAEMFSVAGCFLWFFMLLKEKMMAAAIISLALVAVPLGYAWINGMAETDMHVTGHSVENRLNDWTDSLTELSRDAIHTAIRSVPTVGSIIESVGSSVIDDFVDAASKELVDASGLEGIKTDMIDYTEEAEKKYDTFGNLGLALTAIVFILLCVFWGRRYNYYVDLNKKGTSFLCAIGNPETRKF